MNQLEALKAAYEAATPGEWVDEGRTPRYVNAGIYHVCRVLAHSDRTFGEYDANAQFIALSHNLMPALLEAVEALEELTNAIRFIPLGVHPLVKLHEADIALAKLKGETS